jgi:prophage regulatory protein
MAVDLTEPAAPTIPALALRPREAAAALGISERALWALTAAGEVPHIKLGRCVLYQVSALEKWLSEKSIGGECGK